MIIIQTMFQIYLISLKFEYSIFVAHKLDVQMRPSFSLNDIFGEGGGGGGMDKVTKETFQWQNLPVRIFLGKFIGRNSQVGGQLFLFLIPQNIY